MPDYRSGDRTRRNSNSIFPDVDRDDHSRGGAAHGQDDRGFLSRAGDEIRSWFGDDDAEHRREADARRWDQEQDMDGRYRGGGHDDQWTGHRPAGQPDRTAQRSQMRSNAGGQTAYSHDDHGESFRPVGRSGFGAQGLDRGGSPHDESYRRWRDQQIAQLDAEYDEYCRHRQQQFEQDFSSFRQTRQGASATASTNPEAATDESNTR